MEATPEGRAIAAATRDAAKRKHDEVVKEDKLVPVKKKKQPKGTSTHLVAIPEGYSEAESELDVAVHGELSLGLLFAVGAVFSLVQDGLVRLGSCSLYRTTCFRCNLHWTAETCCVCRYTT
jgi:hypothetical protein